MDQEKDGDQRQGWEDDVIQCGQAGVRASLGNPCSVLFFYCGKIYII